MSNYKKTLWGSFIALLIGTSCCWMSALAIWLGGAAALTIVASFIKSIQLFLLLLAAVLGIVGCILWYRASKS